MQKHDLRVSGEEAGKESWFLLYADNRQTLIPLIGPNTVEMQWFSSLSSRVSLALHPVGSCISITDLIELFSQTFFAETVT